MRYNAQMDMSSQSVESRLFHVEHLGGTDTIRLTFIDNNNNKYSANILNRQYISNQY